MIPEYKYFREAKYFSSFSVLNAFVTLSFTIAPIFGCRIFTIFIPAVRPGHDYFIGSVTKSFYHLYCLLKQLNKYFKHMSQSQVLELGHSLQDF